MANNGASDTVIGFGAGLVLPLTGSETYAGLDYDDGINFGIGYRFFVQ